jgi:serine phosphatase RsbU (regulator of sigma subunit)
MRFRTLLLWSLLLPLVITGAAVVAAMYGDADRHSTEMAHKLLGSVTQQAAQEVFAHSERAVSLARSLEQMGPRGLALRDSDRMALQLADLLRVNPNITWISFSDPEGTFTGAYRRGDGGICINQSHIAGGKTALLEQLVDVDGHKQLVRQEADSGYDPRTRPFYRTAVEARGLVWLPPYIFYEQGIPGISCAVPVYEGKEGGSGKEGLLGVFSVDYDLHYLSELARKLAASPQSRVMVFNADYLLLAHSSVRVVQSQGQREYGKLMTPADVTDEPTQELLQQLRGMKLENLKLHQPVSLQYAMEGRSGAGGGALEVACVLPMRLEEGPVMYVASVAPKSDFAPSVWESSRWAFLIALGAFLAAGLLAYVVAGRISEPITTLLGASERIGKGDLEVAISLGSIREFRRLSGALQAMLSNLREFVRVKSSLMLAREIQRSLLPAAAPEIEGYDIAGYNASCDETGGDYYDFLITEEQGSPALVVALGDMMGHGLPAALLMASARGALRSALKKHHDPAALLTHLNDVFFHDTSGERFMTMCLAIIDLERCAVTWSSAGHDPPILYNPGERRFDEPEGGDLPLGITEQVLYLDYRFTGTCAGQVMFIGSDGVWEAASPGGERFGKERLKAVLALHGEKPAEEIKRQLLESLENFRESMPIHDDVTFIVIKLAGSRARNREGAREEDSPVGISAG